MSQAYLTKFIGVVRETSSANFELYKAGSVVKEFTSSITAQNEIIIEKSDGNQKIFNEMKIDNYQTFDETYIPISGDLTYNATFVAMVKANSSAGWEAFTDDSSIIILQSDKNLLLTIVRQAYGDGLFRLFQEAVQVHTHGYITVP